jgi:hypothetical protein
MNMLFFNLHFPFLFLPSKEEDLFLIQKAFLSEEDFDL